MEDLTYKERFKEMQLTTLTEKIKRGNLNPIYKQVNNLEEMYIKDLILRRKREARNLMRREKIADRNLLEQ